LRGNGGFEDKITHALIADQRTDTEIQHNLLTFVDQFTDALENVRQSETKCFNIHSTGQLCSK
jgi:hypothetical protein